MSSVYINANEWQGGEGPQCFCHVNNTFASEEVAELQMRVEALKI